MKRKKYLLVGCILAICFVACERTTESDNQPPTVEITYPIDNTLLYKGVVDTIRAEATDNNEVVAVQFFINDKLVYVDEEEPYEYEWNTEDSKNTECTIYVKAFDSNENYAFSESVHIYLMITGHVTDIDGNVYNTIKIGSQWWMTENLKVTHYNNGDPIPEIHDPSVWDTLQFGACCIYDNDSANEEIYGRLYNFYAVTDERGLAPEGWHIPSRGDWEVLREFLGGGYTAGGKMKTTGTLEAGTGLWLEPNTGATNESGFSAQPGGLRRYDPTYDYAGIAFGAYFWSTFIDDYGDLLGYKLLHDRYRCGQDNFDRETGVSVRCVLGEEFNYPPDPPYNPDPADYSDSVYITKDLDWRCSDIDLDQLYYDIYFGTDDDPPLLYSDYEASEAELDTLDYHTTYYWKVAAKDEYGNITEGDVWQFTTKPRFIEVLLSPPSGDSYLTGDNVSILSNTNLIDEIVSIELFKSDQLYLVVQESLQTSFYQHYIYVWTIPDYVETGTDYRIKITSQHYPDVFAFSGYISIYSSPTPPDPPPADITVIFPNGGEYIITGFEYDIRWVSAASEYVKIELHDDGNYFETIATSTANDKTFEWTIPQGFQHSNKYQIKVSELPETTSYDISDGYFTIKSNSSGTVTDIDGNVYGTVQVGDQLWMAENLRVTRYNNGDSLRHYKDDDSWFSTTQGAYCSYDNDTSLVTTYGQLYNWYAINNSRNIAPPGWHIPTYQEWQTLMEYLHGWQVAGGSLKSIGTLEAGDGLWHEPNTGATNMSGMSIDPAGFRLYYGGCSSMGYEAAYWVSAEDKTTMPYLKLYFDGTEVNFYNQMKNCGFSVRCIKD